MAAFEDRLRILKEMGYNPSPEEIENGKRLSLQGISSYDFVEDWFYELKWKHENSAKNQP